MATPLHLCEQDVERAVKMVMPKIVRADLTAFKGNMRNVAKFLVKAKGNKKKWFLTMSVDYFNCLLDYYTKVLKLTGFKMNQMDTTLAKDLYIKFLEDRGSLYWNGIVEESINKTNAGIIVCESPDTSKIDIEKVKGKLKAKFDKPTVRSRSGRRVLVD